MSASKKSGKGVPQPALGPTMSTFKQYDLEALGVPREARCRKGGVYHGKHGYTVYSTNKAVSQFEILVPFHVNLFWSRRLLVLLLHPCMSCTHFH